MKMKNVLEAVGAGAGIATLAFTGYKAVRELLSHDEETEIVEVEETEDMEDESVTGADDDE